MADRQFIVQDNRDLNRQEYLPRKGDGKEYLAGDRVVLPADVGEQHLRSGLLGRIEDEN